MTAARSSWLRHLPPVLWSDEPADAGFSLGEALRVFEKVLTGIDDDVAASPPLTARIAAVERLFDPWTAPGGEFLTWLASWVDLRFPTLQGKPVWDDHQRRLVISRIAATYRRRGQRAGVTEYLDLCTAGGLRPRIALDDGSRVLVTVPGATGPAPVAALVSHGPVVDPSRPAGQRVLAEGLVRPRCVAVGRSGALFFGDLGSLSASTAPVPARVWRLTADGRYETAGTPRTPAPFTTVQPAGSVELEVHALAVLPGDPETLCILDRTGVLHTMPADAPAAAPTRLVDVRAAVNGFTGVAMAVDPGGDLVLLDQRAGAGSRPRVVPVAVATATVGAVRELTEVTAAQSLLVEPDGRLLVGDGGNQTAAGGAGNIVRVDPTSGAEHVLLPTDRAANPLVAPVALARGDDGELYALDAGLRPLAQGSFVKAVAEPAVVHRVDLDTGTVRPACEAGRFVYPTGMVARAGRLVVCDPGLPVGGDLTKRWARLVPFAFEVVAHHTAARLPAAGSNERTATLNWINLSITAMVEEQKPAHTIWSLLSAG